MLVVGDLRRHGPVAQSPCPSPPPVVNDRIEQSKHLHARARAMIQSYESGRLMPERFESLAADLVRFQAASVPGYARLCALHGVDPRALRDPAVAPAVPTEAFKLSRVFAFDEHEAAAVFRTSGTTTGARGAHALRDLGTYNAAALAFGRSMLAFGLPRAVPVLVVGPSASDAPDSSLSHMCTLFVRAFGDAAADEDVYFVRAGAAAGRDGSGRSAPALDLEALRARASAIRGGDPVIVLATSLALLRLVETARGARLPLPRGSRVMQTGGFKGRAREVIAAELRRSVAQLFSIDERAVVGEYGMTEISSQFWETTVADERAKPRVYVEPPWARVVPVHPETLAPVESGEVGIARIEDLANVDSAWAVLTQDRVRRVSRGFELLGRTEGAPPRGCSIGLDDMLRGDS